MYVMFSSVGVRSVVGFLVAKGLSVFLCTWLMDVTFRSNLSRTCNKAVGDDPHFECIAKPSTRSPKP